MVYWCKWNVSTPRIVIDHQINWSINLQYLTTMLPLVNSCVNNEHRIVYVIRYAYGFGLFWFGSGISDQCLHVIYFPIIFRVTSLKLVEWCDVMRVESPWRMWDRWTENRAGHTNTWVPFYCHGLTLIPAWISNCIHYKLWDEITYPFQNFNGCTVEV